MTEKNLELQQLSLNDAITEKVLSGGKRFCSSCMFNKPEVGGEVVVSNNKVRTKRWRCAQCVAKVSTRRYASKGNT